MGLQEVDKVVFDLIGFGILLLCAVITFLGLVWMIFTLALYVVDAFRKLVRVFKGNQSG